MFGLFKKRKSYSCYFVTLHFAHVEQAASWINSMQRYLVPSADTDAMDERPVNLIPTSMNARILRGGETLPMCPSE